MQKSDIGNSGFADFDLNHLRALKALIETASVIKAAGILGLSQPAASRVVAKLRQALSDPLLVRTSRGYVLTQGAESLYETVVSALSAAECVFTSIQFQPSTSKRKFNLGTTDYGTLSVLVPAIKRLVEAAPGISIVIHSWDEGTIESLERGKLDLALFADGELPPDFHATRLFSEGYVLITRKDHPLTRRRPKSLRELGAAIKPYGQLQALYPEGRIYSSDDVLARLGIEHTPVSLATPYFSTAPFLVAESDLIMAIPRRIAESLRNSIPIEIVEISSRQEDFPYHVIWHERAHRDPGVKWLRQQIAVNFKGS